MNATVLYLAAISLSAEERDGVKHLRRHPHEPIRLFALACRWRHAFSSYPA